MLQKSFTSDFLTKRKKKNERELPQYYVENHHQGIVSREVFDYVQTLSLTGRTVDNPVCRKITCQECGNYYGPRTWHAYKLKRKQKSCHKAKVWKCRTRTTCGTPHIYDGHIGVILSDIIRLILQMREDLSEVLNEILGFDVDGKSAEFKIGSRDDVAMIIEKIVVSKDRKLMITLLDGSE